MERLSLLIVDDEPWIRRGLAAKVRKSCLGFEEVYEAADAPAAWRLIGITIPDIILCDIRMPGVDGLAFCETIARSMPEIRLILVSGFDEFDYVRRALQFGAVDYLLKPVEGYQLRRALEKALEQIQNRRAGKPSKARPGTPADRNRDRYATEPGTDPIDGETGERIPAFSAVPELYQSMCIYDPTAREHDLSESVGAIVKGTELWHEGVDIAWYDKSEFEAVVVIGRSAKVDCESKVDWLSRALLAREGRTGSELATVGVSVPGRNLERSIQEARLTMMHRVLVGCGTVIRAELLRSRRQAYRLHPDRTRVLHELLKCGNGSRITEILTDIRREVAAARISYRCAANVYQHLILLSRDWSAADWPDGPAEEAPPFYQFCDLEEAFAYLADLFSRVTVANSPPHPDDHAGLIYTIKEYIDAHFADKPSLKELAVRRHMNATYLSELFHRTMGITFQQYLMKTRIDEAKLLLARGECRMSEVAERSGFSDHTYFRKVFRRLTGISPQQFLAAHAAGERPRLASPPTR